MLYHFITKPHRSAIHNIELTYSAHLCSMAHGYALSVLYECENFRCTVQNQNIKLHFYPSCKIPLFDIIHSYSDKIMLLNSAYNYI